VKIHQYTVDKQHNEGAANLVQGYTHTEHFMAWDLLMELGFESSSTHVLHH